MGALNSPRQWYVGHYVVAPGGRTIPVMRYDLRSDAERAKHSHYSPGHAFKTPLICIKCWKTYDYFPFAFVAEMCADCFTKDRQVA